MAHDVRRTAETVSPELSLGAPLPRDDSSDQASAAAVPLDELVTIAVLTPAQAALVAAELLDAARTDGAGPPRRVHAVVRADGGLDVTDRVNGSPGVSRRALLDEIVRSARRLPAHPQSHQLWLLHQVEEQADADTDPAQRAAVLRQALAEVLGDDAETRIRRELAALVEAFAGIAVSRSASSVRMNGETVGAAPVPGPETLRPLGHPARPTARRRNRTRWLLVAAVVLALVVAGGYLVLRGPGSGLLDRVGLGGDSSDTTASPPPSTHPHHATHRAHRHAKTVPTVAPRHAGSVRGVTLQKTGSCQPGAACGVTVTVSLAPASGSQVVGWRVGAVRACTRHVTWSPETTVTAQPGWTHVFSTSSVDVPKGHQWALIAVTSTPDHAQSPAIPVAGAPLHC